MALKGNLKDFSITQLFNLVHLAGKTGLLIVEDNSQSARVYFKQGKLVQAALDGKEPNLATLLVKAGRISPDQAGSVVQRAKSETDKELGLLLLKSGYCNQRDIIQVVKSHILENAYPLFIWTRGSFFFDSDVSPPDEQITLSLDLESIIIEGTRRIKEWGQLRDDLPSLDIAIKFVDKPDTRLRNVRLTAEEWRVISFVSPKNSLRQIADACGMNEFQIRKTVYRLLLAGLVEIVRPKAEAPTRTVVPTEARHGHGASTPSPPTVDRGLLTRLVRRIKTIAG
jgi:hypothetical protein